MTMFLYSRLGAPKAPEKNIPFEPQVWYSAARNISSDQYATQRTPEAPGMPSFEGTEFSPV